MVAVLSPFLDDAVAQLAVVAARRGNLVVAIDVLPQPLVADPETPWGEAVLALVRAERRARLDGLASHGVPVLRWTLGEPATAAATLHRLTSGRRPRLIRAGR
jgi:hypothetical protein